MTLNISSFSHQKIISLAKDDPFPWPHLRCRQMKQNLACLGFACVWGTSYSPSGQPGKMRVRELFGFTGVQAKFTGNWDTGFWTILRYFPQPCPLKRLPNRYIVYSLGHVDNICRHINSRTKWAVDTDCPLGYLLIALLAFFLRCWEPVI